MTMQIPIQFPVRVTLHDPVLEARDGGLVMVLHPGSNWMLVAPRFGEMCIIPLSGWDDEVTVAFRPALPLPQPFTFGPQPSHVLVSHPDLRAGDLLWSVLSNNSTGKLTFPESRFRWRSSLRNIAGLPACVRDIRTGTEWRTEEIVEYNDYFELADVILSRVKRELTPTGIISVPVGINSDPPLYLAGVAEPSEEVVVRVVHADPQDRTEGAKIGLLRGERPCYSFETYTYFKHLRRRGILEGMPQMPAAAGNESIEITPWKLPASAISPTGDIVSVTTVDLGISNLAAAMGGATPPSTPSTILKSPQSLVTNADVDNHIPPAVMIAWVESDGLAHISVRNSLGSVGLMAGAGEASLVTEWTSLSSSKVVNVTQFVSSNCILAAGTGAIGEVGLVQAWCTTMPPLVDSRTPEGVDTWLLGLEVPESLPIRMLYTKGMLQAISALGLQLGDLARGDMEARQAMLSEISDRGAEWSEDATLLLALCELYLDQAIENGTSLGRFEAITDSSRSSSLSYLDGRMMRREGARATVSKLRSLFTLSDLLDMELAATGLYGSAMLVDALASLRWSIYPEANELFADIVQAEASSRSLWCLTPEKWESLEIDDGERYSVIAEYAATSLLRRLLQQRNLSEEQVTFGLAKAFKFIAKAISAKTSMDISKVAPESLFKVTSSPDSTVTLQRWLTAFGEFCTNAEARKITADAALNLSIRIFDFVVGIFNASGAGAMTVGNLSNKLGALVKDAAKVAGKADLAPLYWIGRLGKIATAVVAVVDCAKLGREALDQWNLGSEGAAIALGIASAGAAAATIGAVLEGSIVGSPVGAVLQFYGCVIWGVFGLVGSALSVSEEEAFWSHCILGKQWPAENTVGRWPDITISSAAQVGYLFTAIVRASAMAEGTLLMIEGEQWLAARINVRVPSGCLTADSCVALLDAATEYSNGAGVLMGRKTSALVPLGDGMRVSVSEEILYGTGLAEGETARATTVSRTEDGEITIISFDMPLIRWSSAAPSWSFATAGIAVITLPAFYVAGGTGESKPTTLAGVRAARLASRHPLMTRSES